MTPLWTVGKQSYVYYVCIDKQTEFLAGLDSIVHISEEAKNANTAVPYGILFATLSSVALGWGQSLHFVLPLSYVFKDILKGINVALAFCMGTDLQNIVNSPIGQPMAIVERW